MSLTVSNWGEKKIAVATNTDDAALPSRIMVIPVQSRFRVPFLICVPAVCEECAMRVKYDDAVVVDGWLMT
jgi:hypothetical protein